MLKFQPRASRSPSPRSTHEFEQLLSSLLKNEAIYVTIVHRVINLEATH